jgi:cbb3-type cytochrome oxidase subunit 3
MMDVILHNAPMIALLGFFIGFVGIVFWVYAPKNKSLLQKNAEIPFKE